VSVSATKKNIILSEKPLGTNGNVSNVTGGINDAEVFPQSKASQSKKLVYPSSLPNVINNTTSTVPKRPPTSSEKPKTPYVNSVNGDEIFPESRASQSKKIISSSTPSNNVPKKTVVVVEKPPTPNNNLISNDDEVFPESKISQSKKIPYPSPSSAIPSSSSISNNPKKSPPASERPSSPNVISLNEDEIYPESKSTQSKKVIYPSSSSGAALTSVITNPKKARLLSPKTTTPSISSSNDKSGRVNIKITNQNVNPSSDDDDDYEFNEPVNVKLIKHNNSIPQNILGRPPAITSTATPSVATSGVNSTNNQNWAEFSSNDDHYYPQAKKFFFFFFF
jgi:hypothetical protein